MKKFFISLVSCLLMTTVYAQSTCETRVDAHQRATTNQRVAYCLTPDFGAADTAYSGLVFAGVSSHQPQDTQPVVQEHPTAKQGSFKSKNITVNSSYIPTVQFPEVMRDNASQAIEVYTDGEPLPVAPMETSMYVETPMPVEMPMYVETPMSVETPMATTTEVAYIPANQIIIPQDEFVYVESPMVPAYKGNKTLQSTESSKADDATSQNEEPSVTETKAGVKARQNKPGRRLVEMVSLSSEEEAVTPGKATSQESATVVDSTNPYLQEDSTQTYAPDTLSDNTYTEIPADTYTSETSN